MPALPTGALRALIVLGSLAIVLWLLSWLAAVLVPVALAALLTFLLGPLVSILERRNVPRLIGVVLVVVMAVSAFGGVGFLVGRQVGHLLETFPQYEDRIGNRLLAFRSGEPGLLDRMRALADRLTQRLDAEAETRATPERPLPVQVVASRDPFHLAGVWSALGPALAPLATIGLALVLLVFMLLRREDLRDRVIRLLGRGRLTVTTRALDDAAGRISRYLLLQLAVNAGFGLATTIGLSLIGVPYAALFGFLAGVLRYIPYVGAWIGAVLPVALAMLVFDGWVEPLAVIGLFVALDVTANLFVEPYLYGRGLGVSEAALLVMVAFWTWLWGPVGIVLATPLTACLVVAGRHVPQLEFFDTLLGDAPALEPPVRLYQRLLAHDVDEAAEVAEGARGELPLAEAYDRLLVPALARAGHDRLEGELDEPDFLFVTDAVRHIADMLALQSHDDHLPPPVRHAIIVAADDAKDEAAAVMLAQLLERQAIGTRLVGPAPARGEIGATLGATPADLACIVALPPGGLAAARLMLRRLRIEMPGARTIVVRCAPLEDARAIGQLRDAGAHQVALSLAEATGWMVATRPAEAAAPRSDPGLQDGSIPPSNGGAGWDTSKCNRTG